MDIWNRSLFVHFIFHGATDYIRQIIWDSFHCSNWCNTSFFLWKMKSMSHETHIIIIFSNSSLFFGGFLLFAEYFGFDWAEQTARSVICIKWIPLLSRMKDVFLSFSGWLSNKRIQSVIVNQTALTVKIGNVFSPYL